MQNFVPANISYTQLHVYWYETPSSSIVVMVHVEKGRQYSKYTVPHAGRDGAWDQGLYVTFQ
jgi:hypothetical protein